MTPEEREGWLSAFSPKVRKAIQEEIDDATKPLVEALNKICALEPHRSDITPYRALAVKALAAYEEAKK